MARRDNLIAFLVLLPSLALLAIFVYGFIFQTIQASLTDWGRDPAQALALDPVTNFVGLDNYRALFTWFTDFRFRQGLVNTFYFTLMFVGGAIVLGLFLAVLLDRRPRGEGFFRTIFLFPMALSFVVTGTIWRWMLQPRGGVNQLPTLVGLPPSEFGWLTSRAQVWQFDWQVLPTLTGLVVAVVLLAVAGREFRAGQRLRAGIGLASAALVGLWSLTIARGIDLIGFPEMHGFSLAMIGVTIAAVWQMSGYTMALYLAGLRGVPDELREAARVDGASEFQIYRLVIMPMLRPITLAAVIILGHISLKVFDLIFAMAGLDNSPTDVPAVLMFLTAFRANQFAEGAAIGVILLVLVALVIIPYLATSLRGERRR